MAGGECAVESSHNSARFLREVCAQMLYIKSVQVGGGSEFRGELEEAAEKLGVKGVGVTTDEVEV